jgi:NAD(P)-dependent dehydrogenase (short-subunit alcohol dehydrogenase family)
VTQTLAGTNTHTGSTRSNLGTLALDFSAPTPPATNIISSSSVLHLAGGTLISGGGKELVLINNGTQFTVGSVIADNGSASALGLVGRAGRTPYTASKGAVIQMTRTLALETAADDITANAICPGPFLTEMNTAIADTEDGQKFVVGATALKRWARLEEIQGAAIYLAREAASYVTGATLTVDGGWTAQ